LRPIAERTGLQIVVGFSLYKERFPDEVLASDVDELVELFVRQAQGVGDWGIRPGLYGEVGTSMNRITPAEERCLRAVARAHKAKSLAISTHCTLGTMAEEQISILAEEGADLSRVVIGHLDLEPDLGKVEGVLMAGANVAFDTFGKEWFDYLVPEAQAPDGVQSVKWTYHRPESQRIEALAKLLGRGYDHQVVLSCDISGPEAYLNPSTHGDLGYAYLPKRVLPALRQAGVTEESIRRMLVDNPARILAGEGR
ncbi:MAG: aryldialkylphosphatase, partial [Actinomycetota bacterium]|nr:aryldialkylphosphatase [Actinomycetota bacterium]